MDNYLICKDVTGKLVTIDLFTSITLEDFTLFGMDVGTISEFRHQYLKLGGILPITKESVRVVFNAL